MTWNTCLSFIPASCDILALYSIADVALFTPYMELTDRAKLVGDYHKSSQRLILLDYDGTLIPFFDIPRDAKPGSDVLKLLEMLAMGAGNEVVLISGRDKDTLGRWFGINAGYVAEHGAWIKEKGKEWETTESRSDWKKEIRPVLELYVGRTPGSFIEEKEFSLVWHYRKTDPCLAQGRVKELVGDLTIAEGLGLQVLEGNRVIEVKNAGINKGKAASRWIEKKEWDFILAIGDDVTDEDIFGALPKTAYSIKVGPGPSLARFSLDSPSDVLSLLRELVGD